MKCIQPYWLLSLVFILCSCPMGLDEDEKESLQAHLYGSWEFTSSKYNGSEIFEMNNNIITFKDNATFHSTFSFFWSKNPDNGTSALNGTWEVDEKFTYWTESYPRLRLTNNGISKFWRISKRGNTLIWLLSSENIDTLMTWRVY